jgi:protein phosphatase
VENEARLRRARGEHVFVHEHYRNALTRCIGQPTPPVVDVQTLPIFTGDIYLFATDGVTRMLSDFDMIQVINRPIDVQDRLIELVRWANARGGTDNSTAVLVLVDQVP